jgi:hypothetical protein
MRYVALLYALPDDIECCECGCCGRVRWGTIEAFVECECGGVICLNEHTVKDSGTVH